MKMPVEKGMEMEMNDAALVTRGELGRAMGKTLQLWYKRCGDCRTSIASEVVEQVEARRDAVAAPLWGRTHQELSYQTTLAQEQFRIVTGKEPPPFVPTPTPPPAPLPKSGTTKENRRPRLPRWASTALVIVITSTLSVSGALIVARYNQTAAASLAQDNQTAAVKQEEAKEYKILSKRFDALMAALMQARIIEPAAVPTLTGGK